MKIEHYDADGILKTSSGGGGAASPLTTKGDLWGYDTEDTRVPVGSDDLPLVADSGDAQGVTYKILPLEGGGTESDLSATGPGALVQTAGGAAVTVETLDETRGGTAQTTFTTGDILRATAADTLGKLTVGSDGYVIVADAGETGGMSYEPLPFVSEGRLTLTSGTPVTTSDVTGASTIYFTPYKGNRISIYDGSRWQWYEFTEKAVSVPATTTTPFDIFIYDNAGTLTLETTDWTNDTTRATALTLQDGVYVKSGATTRRYLSTSRTTGVSGETEDSLSARFLWNYYNRVNRGLRVTDSNSHTYATSTYRYWNNDSSNKIEMVFGVLEDVSFLAAVNSAFDVSADGVAGVTAFGFNTTGGFTNEASLRNDNDRDIKAATICNVEPQLGYNYGAWLEFATNTVTFKSGGIYAIIRA